MNDRKKATSLKDLGKLVGGSGSESKHIRGRIKTYRKDKRFGFITPVDGKKDVFFHVSVVREGEPAEGIEVRFRIGKGRDGRTAATEVIILKNGVQQAEKPDSDIQLNIPDDTASVLCDRVMRCENYSLALNRFIEWKLKNDEDLPQIPNDFLLNQTKFSFSETLFNQVYIRWQRVVSAIAATHCICSLSAATDWRMVVGLGAENVHETSMTLHHIYGIPYIPGSAVKGIARNSAVQELMGDSEEPDVMDALISLPDISKLSEEKKREEIERVGEVRRQNKKIVHPKETTVDKIMYGWAEFKSAQRIFGGQAQAGKVIFLDAFPEEKINIKVDIMNPHYPDYYGKGEPPADWQNPRPINFLAVENTTFAFCLAAEKQDAELLSLAERWLKLALQSHGVGAKTSVGYGYFHSFST